MLKFTKTQMQANLKDDHDFVQWYVHRFMRKNLQEEYFRISDEGKCEMVLNGRRYAEAFGFRDIDYQIEFITLMWRTGSNFFAFDCFRKILEQPGLAEKEKIDRIYQVPGNIAARAIMNTSELWWWPDMVPPDFRYTLPERMRDQ